MGAATKTVDKKILHDLVPLDALSESRFSDISRRIVIEEVQSGRYLFQVGERDNQTIYLLEGNVSLLNDKKKVVDDLKAGTANSRHPIAGNQPRTLSAKTTTKALIARVDSGLLDVFLAWDGTSGAEVAEVGMDADEDWMTRILKSEAFIKIPPASIQSLLMRMKSIPVTAGMEIFRQGDEGDYFYTIDKGKCTVTRKSSPEGEEKLLAELSDSDFFGEEALVSDAPRNATVTMLTDGVLMRLAKKDFLELMVKPLVKYIDYGRAAKMVEEGAVWLDVRTPGEYAHYSLDDSVNVPLADLREEFPEMISDANYVICCDTGRRSTSAAFLLSHRGLKVYLLEGGLNAVPPEVLHVGEMAADGGQGADVINFTRARDAGTASEQQEQLEKLRLELEASSERLGSLDAQLQSEGEEKQTLQGAYDKLREEHQARITELGDDLELAQKQAASLQAELAAARTAEQKLRKESESLQQDQQQHIKTLQADIKQSGKQIKSLQAEVSTATEGMEAARQQTAAALQEQTQLAADLRVELAGSRQKIEQLEADIERLRAEQLAAENDAGAALAEQQDRASSLGDELENYRQQHEAVCAKLGTAEDQANALQDETQALKGQIDDLHAELQSGKEQFQQESAAAIEQRQQLEQELEELRQANASRQEQLAAAAVEKESLGADLQKQQQENEQLRAGKQQAELQAQEQAGHAASLAAEKKAADEMLAKLQAAWESERSNLVEAGKDLDKEANVLREQLAALQAEAASEKALLEEELQAHSSESSAQLEQQERRHDELKQEQARLADELKLILAEREELQQKLDVAGQNEDRLQREQESLKEQIASLSGTADEKVHALQEQLSTEQQRFEKLFGEKEKQLEELNETLRRNNEASSKADREKEKLNLQLGEVQGQLAKLESHAKNSASESEGAARKAQEARQALEGQVSKLQEELEQARSDLLERSEAAQDDAARLSEELDAERLAREEERTRMAAQQQELQEQLKTLESKHQEYLSSQPGDIEKLVNDARAEEHARLKQALDKQAQAEQQVQALQADLEQAQAATKAAVQQEKQHSRAELTAVRKQKAAADALKAEFESRLRQLTQARDTALEEQQTAQQEMNALRAELEEVHSQVAADKPQLAAAIEKLRAELGEARSGAEKAIRLRATAEAAHAAADREIEALRKQLSESTLPASPLSVPAPGAAYAHARPAAHPIGRRYGWLGAVIGLSAVSLVALAVWVTLSVEDPLSILRGGPTEPVVEGDVRDKPGTGEVGQAPPAPAVQQAEARTETPVQQAAPAPVAGRSFSDRLDNGSSGPLMVEIPAARFMMGSVGNSLNFDERPRHAVHLQKFSISKYEVTFAEYDRFVRASGRRLPAAEGWGRGKRPVINVSWDEAVAYTRWLSKQTGFAYRLPSEAQWEFAASGGSEDAFWWQDDADTVHGNCFGCGSEWDAKQTAPVGSFAANAFGLHDTAGNAQEWTEDCYQRSYKGAPDDGRAWVTPDCTERVVRGGAFSSPQTSLRTTKRGQVHQDTRLDNIGFRVVRIN